jgi:hypothetical protein
MISMMATPCGPTTILRSQFRSLFLGNDFNDGDALLTDHYFAIE